MCKNRTTDSCQDCNKPVCGLCARNADFVAKHTVLSKHVDIQAVVLRSNCCLRSNTQINLVDWYRFYKQSHRVYISPTFEAARRIL